MKKVTEGPNRPLLSWGKVLTFLFVAVALPVTAFGAGERGGKRVSITINLFDAVAVFPPPSWQTTHDLKEHEIHRQGAQNQFILEFIPKSESFQSWSKMHAVYAIRSARLEFDKFIDLSLQPFRQACGIDTLEEREIKRDETSAFLVILCPNSPDGPSKYGYGDGVGEVTLMWFGYQKDTKVKVYQHWRGDSFETVDPGSWPVDESLFSRSVEEFNKIRLIGR